VRRIPATPIRVSIDASSVMRLDRLGLTLRRRSRQRLRDLLRRRHHAPRLLRAQLYAVACVGFSRMARGPADRLRLLLVGADLIGREFAGRKHGALRWVAVDYLGHRLIVGVDRVNDLDVMWEVFADKQYDQLRMPQPPSTILDLGAHIGTTLLALHVRYPKARLAAVEPDPMTFRRLERNLAGLEQTSLRQAAVTASDEDQVDFFPSDDAWESGSTPSEDRGGAVVVQGRSFATLMREFGLDRVDLLKVDIEGAEWALVSSLDERQFGTLVMEWHADMHGHSIEELRPLLPTHEVVAQPMRTPGRYMVVARPMPAR
jgi:FkbM family methyltransferase